MLFRSPEFHGDGAQLHLHLHEPLFVLQEDGDLHDEVEAAVAVGLGILDIILAPDQPDVVLLQETVRQHIDVVYEGTDHPDAGDVEDILRDGFQREGQVLPHHLVQDAGWGLQAVLDGIDGVAVMVQGEALVQDAELRLDLHDGAAVAGHQVPGGGVEPLEGLDGLLVQGFYQLFREELPWFFCIHKSSSFLSRFYAA